MPKKVDTNEKLEKDIKVKKSSGTKKAETSAKKAPNKSTKKETANKNSKVSKTTLAKTSSKKVVSKKSDINKTANLKKNTAKKIVTEKKVSRKTKKIEIKSSAKNNKTISIKEDESTEKVMLAEYYDLPYRYNQTIVKILAQTPTTLFVYWDISDSDRNNLVSNYGDNFFYETYPVLIVHNLTHNYSSELEINDFANSWYIRTRRA